MAQNGTENSLTVNQEKAAVLVVDDTLTDDEIAGRLKIGRRTLARWKNLPEFRARLDELREKVRQALESKGIAEKSNRIAALVDRQRRMEAVIKARATQYEGIPAGDTGLLVKETRFVKVLEVKAAKNGSWPDEDEEIITPTRSVQPVDYYAVDTALLKEMRETEKQVAQEIGDWADRFVFGGDKDNPIAHVHSYEDLRKLPPEEIVRRYREALAASGENQQP